VARVAEIFYRACLFQQEIVLTGVDTVTAGALVGCCSAFYDVRSVVRQGCPTSTTQNGQQRYGYTGNNAY
jgi:hypothetical protein